MYIVRLSVSRQCSLTVQALDLGNVLYVGTQAGQELIFININLYTAVRNRTHVPSATNPLGMLAIGIDT